MLITKGPCSWTNLISHAMWIQDRCGHRSSPCKCVLQKVRKLRFRLCYVVSSALWADNPNGSNARYCTSFRSANTFLEFFFFWFFVELSNLKTWTQYLNKEPGNSCANANVIEYPLFKDLFRCLVMDKSTSEVYSRNANGIRLDVIESMHVVSPSHHQSPILKSRMQTFWKSVLSCTR